MEKVVKVTNNLVTVFAVCSLILITCGWTVSPLIFGGLDIAGIIFTIVMYFLVIPVASKAKSGSKSTQTPLRRLVLKFLLLWIAFFSILFVSISIYTFFDIIKSQEFTQISESLKILSLAFISVYFFMCNISLYLQAKAEKINVLRDGEERSETRYADSLKHSYLAVVFVLMTTFISSCLFQSIFVMKYKVKFAEWFSEMSDVLLSGKKFEDAFTVERVSLKSLSYIIQIFNNDTTTIIIVVALVFMLVAVLLGKALLSTMKDVKDIFVIVRVKFAELFEKIFKRANSDHGHCVACRRRVKLVSFAPYERNRIDFPEESIIPDAVETLKKGMVRRGVPFDLENFTATYIQYDVAVKDTVGNELDTPSACSMCFFTVYDDFIGKRENGQGIIHVDIIGSRDTGKSCFVASVFNDYNDEMMIEGTPEYRYFNDMWQSIIKYNTAPEATGGNVRSSPVLTIKSGLHYVCMEDLAGEPGNIQVAASAVKKNDVVAILVDIGNPDTIEQARKTLTFIREKKVSKVVICITKIDRYPEYDCMSPEIKEKNFKNSTISDIYNSNFSKKIRKKIMSLFDSEEKRTGRFLGKLEDNSLFMDMYRTAKACSKKTVAIVAHAGLGTGTDSDYTLQGDYNPKYIRETIETFIS